MLVNKNRTHKINGQTLDFKIFQNQTKLERAGLMKYLGEHTDETLSWAIHINHIALKLSKCNGIIYKLLMTLRELQNFVYALLQFSIYSLYNIVGWDMATNILLHLIEVS